MGIVNRRNAVVGWAALKIGKRVAKKKASAVVPSTDESGRPNKPAILVALAGLGGVLMFWRRRGGGPEPGGS